MAPSRVPSGAAPITPETVVVIQRVRSVPLTSAASSALVRWLCRTRARARRVGDAGGFEQDLRAGLRDTRQRAADGVDDAVRAS